MTEIIAEISGNHEGSLYNALRLIEAARDCGCDAVKFQLYKPEDMPVDGGDYASYAVPDSWLKEMFDHARDCDIELFASVFAPWAIGVLEYHGCMTYKIASPESTRLPSEVYLQLGQDIVQTGKRLIISSGKAHMHEILELIPHPDIALYCKAGYPATVDESDLRYMSRMTGRYHPNFTFMLTGFSDHTIGIRDTLAMIGAGAQVVEKHFKVTESCIDAAFSASVEEMKLLCEIAHR